MISLVIPTYNEKQNIAELVERAGTALAACGDDYELIVVDDNSPDGTADLVRSLARDRPWLRLLVREAEPDLSAAVVAGWRVARGQMLGCMDGDLQHPPELLPLLAERLRKTGAEIVVGSRHIRGGGVSDWRLERRFISWTATLMATFILPGTLGKIRDPMSGFFLLRRSVVENRALDPIGYKILLEVLAKGDYQSVEEVPFIFEERVKGGSKLGPATVWKYLAHLLRISRETGEATRILKYGVVGLSGAVVNFISLLWLAGRVAWPLPAAALSGAALAIVNNFIWNERFTFWETRQAEPGWRRLFSRFLAFAIFSAAGVGINAALIWFLAGNLGWRLAPSVIAGIGIAGAWNFSMNSNVTWQAWWNRQVLSKTAIARTPEEAAYATQDGLVYVPCNLCQSTRFKVLYAGDGRHNKRVTAQDFRCTSEAHGGFTNIVQCRDCPLIYENPREEEAMVDAMYAAVEDPTYQREEQGRIRTFSKLLDCLERQVRPGRVVDVGCYTGVFLDLARQRGWQTLGVEPSRWAARIAQERGLTVLNVPLRHAGLSAESADLLTMWDVIEHLHDPLAELREAHRLLRPGGLLALSTMDAGCLFARLAGRHWPWYMRMHFYYFTRDTMTRMLAVAGFRVLASERHKRIVSLRYLIEKAVSLFFPAAPSARWLARPFGRFYLTVDLGDIMNVYAIRTP